MAHIALSWRKLSLVSQINMAQMELMMITDARTRLSDNAASAQLANSIFENGFNDCGSGTFGCGSSNPLSSGWSLYNTAYANSDNWESNLCGGSFSCNQDIYGAAQSEGFLEQLQKALETKIQSLQKELESVEKYEGQAIERGTPNYGGVQ